MGYIVNTVQHPHINPEVTNEPWFTTKYATLYKRNNWWVDSMKPGNGPQKRLRWGQKLVEENHELVWKEHPMGERQRGKHDIVAFLAQLTHRGQEPVTYNPFMSITVCSPNVTNRFTENSKDNKSRSITTTTGLVDTGAIDSDYISTSFANNLVQLGYTIVEDYSHSISTPSSELPPIKCRGIIYNLSLIHI